ncbi:hypothetical protein H4J66_16035 [Colwellia sp. MB3u-55]|jgi:hypothetical protein|nr:hypothetical protein [Colwellia sp. MB3u-55]
MKKIIFILVSFLLIPTTNAVTINNCKFDNNNLVILVSGVNRYIKDGKISHTTKGFLRGKRIVKNTISQGSYPWIDYDHLNHRYNISIDTWMYGEVDLFEICN